MKQYEKRRRRIVGCFFTYGLYLYLKEIGELDEEKFRHETSEETERHWQQLRQRLKDNGMWRDE